MSCGKAALTRGHSLELENASALALLLPSPGGDFLPSARSRTERRFLPLARAVCLASPGHARPPGRVRSGPISDLIAARVAARPAS